MRIIGNFDGSTSSRFMTGEEAERDGIGKYHLLQSSTQRGLSCYPLFYLCYPQMSLRCCGHSLASVLVGALLAVI